MGPVEGGVNEGVEPVRGWRPVRGGVSQGRGQWEGGASESWGPEVLCLNMYGEQMKRFEQECGKPGCEI